MISSRPILVTGGNGILGSAVLHEIASRGLPFLGWTREDADFSRPELIKDLFSLAAPAGVIHCAAWTDVDAAETQVETCRTVNVVASGMLARSAQALRIPFVYVSSGGIFDGQKLTAYDEFDEPAPRTVYHRSKYEGELAVRAAHDSALVARVGWLYGGEALSPKNFVAARLREANKTPVVYSSNTQFGTPTWTRDAAKALVDLFAAKRSGLIHIAPPGPMASRLDYVREIFLAAGFSTHVEPAAPGAFNRRANVPPNEALASVYADRCVDLSPLRTWREALASYVKELISNFDIR
jgi:dTDP-4-dehydrorhamnose reductase